MPNTAVRAAAEGMLEDTRAAAVNHTLKASPENQKKAGGDSFSGKDNQMNMIANSWEFSAAIESARVEKPKPLPKVTAPADASPHAFNMMAYTDVIGGSAFDTKYACELLTVDPITDLADIEDDCLIVMKFGDGGVPFMERFRRTGRDTNGRFLRPGDERQAYDLSCGCRFVTENVGKDIQIFGRVVGSPREFPRKLPSSYNALVGGAS